MVTNTQLHAAEAGLAADLRRDDPHPAVGETLGGGRRDGGVGDEHVDPLGAADPRESGPGEICALTVRAANRIATTSV